MIILYEIILRLFLIWLQDQARVKSETRSLQLSLEKFHEMNDLISSPEKAYNSLMLGL